MIDTDKYEGHTPAPWVWMEWNTWLAGGNEDGFLGKFLVERDIGVADKDKVDGLLIADAPLLLAEVERLQSEPTVTVDDYHKKGHLYITVRFPDGEEYVGLVEKWEEGDEE